jgi:hypothetical protein
VLVAQTSPAELKAYVNKGEQALLRSCSLHRPPLIINLIHSIHLTHHTSITSDFISDRARHDCADNKLLLRLRHESHRRRASDIARLTKW